MADAPPPPHNDRPSEEWEAFNFTMWLDIGTYGKPVDADEIAYLLRMGGIDALTVADAKNIGSEADQGG